MLKWKVSQRPSSVEFVETSDGGFAPFSATQQQQAATSSGSEVPHAPASKTAEIYRPTNKSNKPTVLVKYVSPTRESDLTKSSKMESAVGHGGNKRKFLLGKHQKQRALDGSENKENSSATGNNCPSDSSNKLQPHHHSAQHHALNLSRGPLTVFCPIKDPTNADGSGVSRLLHRSHQHQQGQSAGRKSAATSSSSKGAWTSHKGLLRPSCNPMRLFSSDDYQRNDSDTGSMSYMTLDKLPVALQMQRDFGAAKRRFEGNQSMSRDSQDQRAETHHAFRTSSYMDHPPKVGGWDSNATYVSSAFDDDENETPAEAAASSNKAESACQREQVQLRAAPAVSKAKQKWKRSSWAIKPFSFNFSNSSASSGGGAAANSGSSADAPTSTNVMNTKPRAFTDAPAAATSENFVIRPIPVKSISPPQQQPQLVPQLQGPEASHQVSRVQPLENPSVAMDVSDSDLLLPSGKCIFSNQYQDNQKPLPRYGFHFNMLPAKKMCQASTGQHIHVRHSSKPLPNALAGLRKPLPLPPAPTDAPSAPAASTMATVAPAPVIQPAIGASMGQRSASTSSIAKPPRKTKSKKRLSVVQEVSKEITPSEVGDMTLRSIKSDSSSGACGSSESSNRTRITHPSEASSGSGSSSSIRRAASTYVNLPPPSATTVLSHQQQHDYINLPPLPAEVEKRDSPGKVKQLRFAPTLPPIDPIFRIRTQQQIDARRKCISALETDEILAGLDVLAHDITPSLTVKPLTDSVNRFSNEAGNRRPFSRFHHQQSHNDSSCHGVKKMLNMSAGGSDGTDSGVISESALSPSFTSRTLISPFSDSLLEEPVVLDELFSSSNAICAEIYDADSSTTLGTSRTSAGTVVTAIRRSPAPPALKARKMRSRSLTEIRQFASSCSKNRPNDPSLLERTIVADDDSGCCWLYENHDAVLTQMADARRRATTNDHQLCEWYASESPLKFTGPKVGRPLRRSNSLYSSYSNLVEHLLFRPEDETATEKAPSNRDRQISSMLGREDSFRFRSGGPLESPLRHKSMTLPHLADLSSAHPGNQSPANYSNLSVEAVLGSSSPPESSISWYQQLESSTLLQASIHHRHRDPFRHQHLHAHRHLNHHYHDHHQQISTNEDDEAPFYENVMPDSRSSSPALSDASSVLRDDRTGPSQETLEAVLCDAFSCSMSIKDDASIMDDLNETPMVFRCSEYSWTTAHASSRDLDAESVASSSDMKVVDVSAPSQYWESDYSQLSCSAIASASGVAAGHIASCAVTSETESWDSHATYRYFKRGTAGSSSSNLPDLIKRTPSAAGPTTGGKRKHHHQQVSKVAKLAEMQRVQELTKKLKDVRDSLLLEKKHAVADEPTSSPPFPPSRSATSLTTGSVERRLRRSSSSANRRGSGCRAGAMCSVERSGKTLKRSERSKIWLEPKGKSVPDASRAEIFDQSREEVDEDDYDDEEPSATDLFVCDDSPLTEEASEGDLETASNEHRTSVSKSAVTPSRTVVATRKARIDLRDGRGLALVTPVSARRRRLLMRRPSFATTSSKIGGMSATKVMTRSSRKPKASVKRLKNKRVGRIGSVKCDDFNRGQVKLAIYENFGLLTIHVMEAKNLRSGAGGKCSSYVKLSLLPDAEDRTFCRTDIVRASNVPNFNERFSFEFLNSDMDKRLMISLWNRASGSRRGEFLGCLSFKVREILSKREYGWYWLLKKSHGRRRNVPVKPSLTSLASSQCGDSDGPGSDVEEPVTASSASNDDRQQQDQLLPSPSVESVVSSRVVEPLVVATPMLPPRADKGRRSINTAAGLDELNTSPTVLQHPAFEVPENQERSISCSTSGTVTENAPEDAVHEGVTMRANVQNNLQPSAVGNDAYGRMRQPSLLVGAGCCVLSKKEFFERTSRLCSEDLAGSSDGDVSSNTSPASRLLQVEFSSKIGCGTLV